jgi:predicted GNAT family N-acyltransferase
MVEIKPLNKQQLLEYIQSPEFGTGTDIPISAHRALAQTRNPRLDDEDVLLILAVQKGTMVGYLGIIPDLIFLKKRKPVKIGWFSCIWVSENARGNGISNKLASVALELWKNQIILTDFVPFTKKIYNRTNQFIEESYLKQGIRLYVKSDLSTILPSKKPIFSKFKWLFRTIDYCANSLLRIRLAAFKEDVSQLNFEFVDHIDEEVNDFIADKQEHQLFKRNAADLNWILHNPWVLSANEKDELNRKYHFSSTTKFFRFYSLKVRNSENTLIAFMIFAQRDDTLKLPYCYHDNCLDTIVKVLNHNLIKWKTKTFTSYDAILAQSIRNNKSPSIFKKEITRSYMISSLYKDDVDYAELEIQDGDGDCSFT